MFKEKLRKELNRFNLKLIKPNRLVYDYVYEKTKSREQALIPANRYNNLYNVQKYENNRLRYIMDKRFIKNLPDVNKAADLLDKHIKNNSLIYQVIDYDVDGITSGAVGFLMFKKIFNYKRYKVLVNNRSWKNGVNDTIIETLLEKHKKQPIGLVVTSDHGSSDGDRIQKLKDAGIDVIVTDHHLPSVTNSPLDIADAFVNHKRIDSLFTNDITGTAVLYFTYVYYALKYLKPNKETINKFYDLLPYVGLTTISDSVDMGDWVNRKFVKYTLNTLNSNRKLTPFWEVIKDTVFSGWFIDQEFISFNLVAKLNSPGRIGNPETSLKLMVADTTTKAYGLLEEIEELNNKRKQIQNDAIKNLDLELVNDDISIAYKKDITGIQGIIASKLLYKNQTTVAFCFTDEYEGTVSGSARSLSKDVSLIELLNKLKNKDYILRYGGHAMACGVELKKDSIETFYEDLKKVINTANAEVNHFALDDLIVEEKQIYKTFMANIAELPYGQNYPQPMYASKIKLINKKLIEKNGNTFLIGTIKLVTDEGLSKSNFKIFHTVTSEEEKERLKNAVNKEMLAVYTLGLNKYKQNKINITAEKLYY